MNTYSRSITQPLTVSTQFADLAFSRIKDPHLVTSIVERTHYWTDGDPFLRRFIYDYVSQYSSQIVRSEGAGIVDEIVRQKIVRNWENTASIPCLNRIKESLFAFQDTDILLISYMQILSRGALSFSPHPHMRRMQAHLLASGLVKQKNSQLVVSNAIFAEIFDMAWIEEQIPGLTRSVTILPREATLPSQHSAPERLPSELLSDAAESVSGDFSLFPVGEGRTGRSQARDRHNLSRRYRHVVALGCVLTTLAGALLVRSPATMEDIFAVPRLRAIAMSEQSNGQIGAAQDRRLFDSGINHATNGRWLSMLQDFCQISKSSHYYAPAENQFVRWYELYPTKVQHARQALSDRENEACGMPTNI